MGQRVEQHGTFYRYAHAGDGTFGLYAPHHTVGSRPERLISQPFDTDESLFDGPAGVPRPHRFRRFAWRTIGLLAIGSASYGCVRIGTNADARGAMLDWLTLGQSEHVRSIGRTVHKLIVTLVD
jgi:hypothetical protein